MTIETENHTQALTAQDQQMVREFVGRLRQRFDGQLVSVILFGSRARGEAEPDSDMDVLVVMSDADLDIRAEVRYLAAEVWLEHGVYLSTRVWSQSHWRELAERQTLLYQNICRDGIDFLALTPTAI